LARNRNAVDTKILPRYVATDFTTFSTMAVVAQVTDNLNVHTRHLTERYV